MFVKAGVKQHGGPIDLHVLHDASMRQFRVFATEFVDGSGDVFAMFPFQHRNDEIVSLKKMKIQLEVEAKNPPDEVVRNTECYRELHSKMFQLSLASTTISEHVTLYEKADLTK